MNNALSILSINDSLVDQRIIKHVLHKAFENLNLYQTDTSEAAINILKQHHIDLIVQDIIRPGDMNGDAFLVWLRRTEQYSTIPVIILSLMNPAKYARLLELPLVWSQHPSMIDQFLVSLIKQIQNQD